MLEALRKQVERVRLLGRALRSTQVVQPVRPARLAGLARGLLRLPFGPHLAVMFHAAAHPDKEALIEYGAAGVHRMTWGQLDATINRLANALGARGVASGSRVALMLPNGREYLSAQQALAKLGATAVQIGYRLKAAEIAYILSNAEPKATLVHVDHLGAMTSARDQAGRGGPMIVGGGSPGVIPTACPPTREAGGPFPPLDRLWSVSAAPRGNDATEWDLALAEVGPGVPVRARGGDAGGVIVYTSGTTGKSKGAHRSWRAIGLETVADMVVQLGVRADDRHLVVCPLYHSAAPAFVAMMLALGATVVLMNHFDPAGALDIIARERVTCTLMVPTMIVRIRPCTRSSCAATGCRCPKPRPSPTAATGSPTTSAPAMSRSSPSSRATRPARC